MADYDRELIAEMLDEYAACRSAELRHTRAAIAEQVNALLAAENADAAGVHTATQPPAVGVDVTDEMVERALVAAYGPRFMLNGAIRELWRTGMTAALRTGGGE